jgi:hypothetical protein
MSLLPANRNLTMRGPFWEADGEVIELAEPFAHPALRALFFQREPRTVNNTADLLVPGTLLAVIRVREVRITPRPGQPALRWRRTGAAPALPLADALASGELSLVLLEADPATWPERSATPSPRLTCLAGEIGLDAFTADTGAVAAIYAATTLAPPTPTDPAPAERPGPARLAGALSVHSSGVSIYGRVSLPWLASGERLSGVFQLARIFPVQPPDHPAYRMTIELERLTGAEQTALIVAWLRLSEAINPPYPQHPRPGPLNHAPAWVTLEIADTDAPPRLFWQMAQWQANPQHLPLFFARGELTVLFSDQSPYDELFPPAALARYIPDQVEIALAGTELQLRIGAPITAEREIIRYSAERPTADEAWSESFQVSALTTAFSASQVAQQLREAQQLPTPEWAGPHSGHTVEPPLLWGCLALHDGWAQLPFLNLTEQIYLDGGLAREQFTPPEFRIAGAAAFRNTHDQRPAAYPTEQPWSLTITNVTQLAGRWTLQADPTNNRFTLRRVQLDLLKPEATISGLGWLARGAPRLADALPDLADWLDALMPLTLATIAVERDLLPPPIVVVIEQLAFRPRRLPGNGATLSVAPLVAALDHWSMAFDAAEALPQLCGAVGAPFPADAFATPPLVWQRHPSLPMIQALPLTQNQAPPNYPAASRQLFPRTLPVHTDAQPARPAAWRFGVLAAELPHGRGAARFPHLLSAVEPTAAWWVWADLPLAALSLPGLFLDGADPAHTPLAATPLPAGYRFDLPYTDEVQALAQAPKQPPDPELFAPTATTPPLAGLEPLTRTTFAAHWQRLSEQASLSGADTVTAFNAGNGQIQVEGLVEPYAWPVQVQADLTAYPGSLSIADVGAPSAPVSGAEALEGISGAFAVVDGALRTADSADAAFRITAGSMAAAVTPTGAYRDQRGLLRAASRQDTGLLRTPLQLEQPDGTTQAYELVSLLEPLSLNVAAAQTWQFWFRDLPLAQEATEQRFERAAVHSPLTEDVNDPEALDRDYNFRQGYEWRLGAPASAADATRLTFCGLDFFPLTLDSVTVGATGVTDIQISGRLQLPLPAHPELADLDNVVRVQFRTDSAGQLQLGDLTPLSPRMIWPLEASGSEIGAGPQLSWRQHRLDPNAGTFTLLDARLDFFLFDTRWAPALPELTFGATLPEPIEQPFTIGPGQPIAPAALSLALNADGAHGATLVLELRLGPHERPDLDATIAFTLTGAREVVWRRAALFSDLAITPDAAHFSYAAQTLQCAWPHTATADGATPSLLPGVPLAPEAPGCAVVQFTVTPAPELPQLQLRRAFVEAVFSARWGRMLHDAGGATMPLAELYAPAAGDLTVGYTLHGDADGFTTGFLLNGVLEVRNLISWPIDLEPPPDGAAPDVTLPATRGETLAPLDHLRHSVRILLNQQLLAGDQLRPTADGALFSLAAARAWQFLAIVEHQAVDVRLRDSGAELGAERRWSVVQEVRVLTPSDLAVALRQDSARRAVAARSASAPLAEQSSGILNQAVSDRFATLLEADAALLMVEASAPLWIGRTEIAPARATALQFLPGGSQYGILSRPTDYGPSDLHDPAWLLMACHFLGRLHDPAPDAANPLFSDPVALLDTARQDAPTPIDPLTLAFTNWGDAQPATLQLSALDLPDGRRFARLDPQALEEHWFRLQAPPPEPAPQLLASVTAALPDTPARLSRAAALQQAFQNFRTAYPPAPTSVSGAVPAATHDLLIWQPGALFAPTTMTATARRWNLANRAGLQALYQFDERSGNTVRDRSGQADPLDLQIDSMSAVVWVPGGGLSVRQSTLIASAQPAERLIRACQATNAISVEVWVRPARTNQQGPARIVTCSEDIHGRNFTLGHGIRQGYPSDVYDMRLRTSSTSRNGRPSLTTPVGALRAERTHVVYTREADGTARLYVNGVLQPPNIIEPDESHQGLIAGDFTNWNLAYRLALANEFTRERTWLGDYYLVAIYNRALEPDEIAQNAAAGRDLAYPWLETGLLLQTAAFRDRSLAPAPQRRHPAATLLPTAQRPAASIPLSFAISPYLGLDYRAADDPARYAPSLIVSELLTQNTATGRLRPIANRAWEHTPDTDPEAQIQAWALAVHRQESPDSPVLLLRYRTLLQLSEEARATASGALLRTSYRFTVLAPPLDAPLARRSMPLRAPVGSLRFREGQYGGAQMPEALQAFEVAPPQVTGVQPIYLRERLTPETGAPDWPWGLSALRVSVRYGRDGQAVIGAAGAANDAAPPLTLWWSTIQRLLQYRSGLRSGKPAAGVPPQFRAGAISSLLPVIAAPPLPSPTELLPQIEAPDRFAHWQPVLPGGLRYLSSGMRPGVFVALRHQLVRQRLAGAHTGAQVGSGSVVVQHRAPRPVPLPPNDPQAPERALQTWASALAPTDLLAVGGTPSDDAYFAADLETQPGGRAANWRLQITLRNPERGVVPADWSSEAGAGQLDFDLTVATDHPPAAGGAAWTIGCALLDGATQIDYVGQSVALPEGSAQRTTHDLRFTLNADGIAALRNLLARKTRGATVLLRLRIADSRADDGFEQLLDLPLRIGGGDALPLPLEPAFLQFEDPEYNRKLASEPARVGAQVSEANQLRRITLAADRTRYNPDGEIVLRYDWDDGRVHTAQLDIYRIDPGGVPEQIGELPNVAAGKLVRVSLPELARTSDRLLEPGDQLEVRLITSALSSTPPVLRMAIVAEPQTPLPDAGYALLRWQRQGDAWVECVRFAWGPAASRIELVNADDLQRGLVRRRAVFQWRDSARPGSETRYAIQKLTVGGATHIPPLERFIGVALPAVGLVAAGETR